MGREKGCRPVRGVDWQALGAAWCCLERQWVMGQLSLLVVAATPMPMPALAWSLGPLTALWPLQTHLQGQTSKAWGTLWVGSPQARWSPPRQRNKGNLAWEGWWQPTTCFSFYPGWPGEKGPQASSAGLGAAGGRRVQLWLTSAVPPPEPKAWLHVDW